MRSKDCDVKYEYKTFRLYSGASPMAEESWADILNKEAEQGWRLVAVDDSIAILERLAMDIRPESGSFASWDVQ
jgi:hypothetical protein